MPISTKAQGAFLCLLTHSASALCITAGSQFSAVLLHHFQGLLLQGNATVDASPEDPVAGARGPVAETPVVYIAGAELKPYLAVTPVASLVVLGLLLAVVVACAIVSTLLLWCTPRSGRASGPTLPSTSLSKCTPRRRGDLCSEPESESVAGLASVASLRPPTSVGHAVTFASETAGRTGRGDAVHSPLPLAPLCPQLVVPATSNLRVLLPELACRIRQDAVLNVCSVPALGGRPLFRARIAECAPTPDDGCGVFLETLCGEHHFAFASTSELWDGPSTASPIVPILRSNGLQFATLQKSHTGDYNVMCGLGILAVFSGDFLAHEAQVTSGQGQVMAQVRSGPDGGYEVTTSPNIDSGMIILGLLLIDKCEMSGKT
mmetsp:Transcript_3691/g.9351  ORF Transcript_3691/g.9351 Transcript_3691/m.9351 type:complete len:376 (-) Transcript_3691:173-1300(-)